MDIQLFDWRPVGQSLSGWDSSNAFHNHSASDGFGEPECPGRYIRYKS